MALNNLGLGFLFTARDLASGVMRRVRGSFNTTSKAATSGFMNMDNAARAAGAGVAILGTGVGILAGGFATANQFGAFEQKMAAVGAVTKATSEQMGKLSDAALQAGIDTQFSPTEATDGLLSLATAGQTAEQATRTLIPVLDLAAGSLGQLGVAQSAEAVVGTLNAYGKSADEAADVTDRLLRVTQLTNFQTKDFEAGLSKAAAAGATFDQGLNDVLITMGLLRNRNIDASSSATAFRESTRRLGSDQRAQQAITDQGVEIFDKATGKMRSIVDITMDLAEVTKGLNDEERNATIVRGFGARGLLAFNAIQKAAFTTQKDGKTITLEGRDAIKALREEMENTKGTAAEFREALLDTFEGQKTLISGSLETLGVVAGEGFAATFKPVIGFMIQGLNVLIKVIKAIPTPVKRFVAIVTSLVGVFLTAVGSLLVFKAGIALLAPAMAAVKAAFVSVAIAMAPLIVLAGVATLAFLAFKTAFEDTTSSVGSKASSLFTPISTAFEGITQLMRDGGFSGAVREEMQKAENSGLRGFVIGVSVLLTRIKNLFMGVSDGFKAVIGDNQPLFEEFIFTLGKLGRTIAGLFGGAGDPAENAKKFERWGQIGISVGKVIGKVAIFIVQALLKVVEIAERVAFAFNFFSDIVGEMLGPAVESAKAALAALGDAFTELLLPLQGAEGASISFTDIMVGGFRIIGFLLRIAISGFTFLTRRIVTTVRFISAGFNFLANSFSNFGEMISAVFRGDFRGAIQAAIREFGNLAVFVLRMAKAMAGALGAVIDRTAQIAGVDSNVAATSDKFFNEMIGKVAGSTDVAITKATVEDAFGGDDKKKPDDFFSGGKGKGPPPDPFASPAVAEQQARTNAAGNENIEDQLRQMNAALANFNNRPIQVRSQLTVDGDVLAESVKSGERSDDATGFSPGAGPQE